MSIFVGKYFLRDIDAMGPVGYRPALSEVEGIRNDTFSSVCSLPICAPLRFVANKVLTAPPPGQPKDTSTQDSELQALLEKCQDLAARMAHLQENPRDIINFVGFSLDIAKISQEIIDELNSIDKNSFTTGQSDKSTYITALALHIKTRALFILTVAATFDFSRIVDIQEIPFLQGVHNFPDLRKLAMDAAHELLHLEMPQAEFIGEVASLKGKAIGSAATYLSGVVVVGLGQGGGDISAAIMAAELLTVLIEKNFKEILAWSTDAFAELIIALRTLDAETSILVWREVAMDLYLLAELIDKKMLEFNDVLSGGAGHPQFEVIQRLQSSMRSAAESCRYVAKAMAVTAAHAQPTNKREGFVLMVFAQILVDAGDKGVEMGLSREAAEIYYSQAIELSRQVLEFLANYADKQAMVGDLFTLLDMWPNMARKISGKRGQEELQKFIDELPKIQEWLMADENIERGLALGCIGLAYINSGRWALGMKDIRAALAFFDEGHDYISKVSFLTRVMEKLLAIKKQEEGGNNIIFPAGRGNGTTPTTLADTIAEFDAERIRVFPIAEQHLRIEHALAAYVSVKGIKAQVEALRELVAVLSAATDLAVEKDFGGNFIIEGWKKVYEWSAALSGGQKGGKAVANLRRALAQFRFEANTNILKLCQGENYLLEKMDALQKLYGDTGEKQYLEHYSAVAREYILLEKGDPDERRRDSVLRERIEAWLDTMDKALDKGDFDFFTEECIKEIGWLRENGLGFYAERAFLMLDSFLDRRVVMGILNKDSRNPAQALVSGGIVFARFKKYDLFALEFSKAAKALMEEGHPEAGRCAEIADTALKAFVYETAGFEKKADPINLRDNIELKDRWGRIAFISEKLRALRPTEYSGLTILRVYALSQALAVVRRIAEDETADAVLRRQCRNLVETGIPMFLEEEGLLPGLMELFENTLRELPACSSMSMAEIKQLAVMFSIEFKESDGKINIDLWARKRVGPREGKVPLLLDGLGIEDGWRLSEKAQDSDAIGLMRQLSAPKGVSK